MDDENLRAIAESLKEIDDELGEVNSKLDDFNYNARKVVKLGRTWIVVYILFWSVVSALLHWAIEAFIFT